MKNLYIFDCFGVVMSDVATLFMDKYITDNAEKEFMCKSVFRKVDTGQIPHERMYEIVSERYNIDLQTVQSEWHGYEYVLNGTIEIIKQLKSQGHTVALLSNASQSYIDYLFAKFDLFKYFDKTFVSSNYNCAKPDREFYAICVQSFDEQFGKIYFTDDNPNNLVGLEQFGITPIQFKSAEYFKKAVGLS